MIEPLGSGGFGEVYRARHAVLGQEVALKLVPLPTAGPSDPERLGRLLREARAAAAVDSPHVVRVLDAGIADGRPFLVMELVTGRSLRDLVREGPMPPARAVELGAQILAGLQAAHASGIVHRDMKPGNVVVTSIPGSDGRRHDFVKILDFGIGKIRTATLAPATMPGAMMGTPGYMAPEQYTGAAEADHRADLYAVAAILYELLSGRLPFEGVNPDSIKRRVLTERPPPLASIMPQLSRTLAEVVDRGLARDPDARWPSAEAFARALSGALRGASRLELTATAAATPPQVPAVPVDGPTLPSPSPSFSEPIPTTVRTRRLRRLVKIALALGAAAGFGSGAMLVYMMMRAPIPPATTAMAAAPAPAAAPIPTPDAAPAPAVDAPPAPGPAPAPAAASPRPRSTPSRTRIDSVRAVGALDDRALEKLTARALPAIVARCVPRSGSETVEVTLHVHAPGRITLASAREGDPALGQCVAERLKEAVPKRWNPGPVSGIVIVKATLAAPDPAPK